MQKDRGEIEMVSSAAKETTGLTLSLCKAFDILSCFTPETPALRVTDITKRVDMTQSNVSRLVATMTAYGYLEKDEDSGYYQLGKQIITLSSIALNHSELRKQAPDLTENVHNGRIFKSAALHGDRQGAPCCDDQ